MSVTTWRRCLCLSASPPEFSRRSGPRGAASGLRKRIGAPGQTPRKRATFSPHRLFLSLLLPVLLAAGFTDETTAQVTVSFEAMDTWMTEGDATDTAQVRVKLGQRLLTDDVAHFSIGIGTNSTTVRHTDHVTSDYSYAITGTSVTVSGTGSDPTLTFTGLATNVVQEAPIMLTPVTNLEEGNAYEGTLNVVFGSEGKQHQRRLRPARGHAGQQTMTHSDPTSVLSIWTTPTRWPRVRCSRWKLMFSWPRFTNTTVTLVNTDQTASEQGDYTGGPYTVTIPAGWPRYRFSIATEYDDEIEGPETFLLSIQGGDLPSTTAAALYSAPFEER